MNEQEIIERLAKNELERLVSFALRNGVNMERVAEFYGMYRGINPIVAYQRTLSYIEVLARSKEREDDISTC